MFFLFLRGFIVNFETFPHDAVAFLESKKQKTDASVIKTIKAASAPSAVVRDWSND